MPEKLSLLRVATDLADALTDVDRSRVSHKNFRPGIGPFGEAPALRLALARMKERHGDTYRAAQTKRTPDLLIPGHWAIEVKLVRPFGDNGKLAEHWSENVLHPYPGNTSSIGDCIKLLSSDLAESKAITIVAYEHAAAKMLLEPVLRAFELLCAEVVGVRLGNGIEQRRENLVHPVHQVLRVLCYEILGRA